MYDVLRSLNANLSKGQKIGIFVLVQTIIIVVITATIQGVTQPKERIVVEEPEDNITADIPPENIELFKRTLWDLISQKSDTVNESVIKDVVIREGTYTETEHEFGTSAEFIIDIDSIKQTYKVNIGWAEDGHEDEYYDDVIIDCPPISEMKYPETVCHGMYNDSYSLNLYLPYTIESPYVDEYSYAGPELYIDGDEQSHTITVVLNPCNNANVYREKAKDYLKTIPNINKYQINYITNDGVDVVCAEDKQ
ncbi:hypothetical protein IKF87_02365 [Candidatus Saccharibacteria bacterium]|nr:hypothetical protein [Candidatus Saccharibacteria bacterium]